MSKAPGVKLACTLTIPERQGTHPAMVLVTGSGPQDRDENILGHKPFLVIADYLARRGVIVLRCDDRSRLMAHLRADQIGSAVHYAEPVHVQKGYAEKSVVPKDGLPVTSAIVDKILSLPMYPELTDDEADRVIASLRRYDERR